MTETLGVLAADQSQILAHPTRTNRSAAQIIQGREELFLNVIRNHHLPLSL